MEESSERLVQLEQHDEITRVVDDMAVRSTPQDLALAVTEIYDRVMVLVEMEELLFVNRTLNQIRDFLPSYITPSRYLDFISLHEEECQRTRPALPKARRSRHPPHRVSRRSSEVSPPVYLRHRFLPQSRKDSSSRRQR